MKKISRCHTTFSPHWFPSPTRRSRVLVNPKVDINSKVELLHTIKYPKVLIVDRFTSKLIIRVVLKVVVDFFKVVVDLQIFKFSWFS